MDSSCAYTVKCVSNRRCSFPVNPAADSTEFRHKRSTNGQKMPSATGDSVNILIVDDSPVYHLMILRGLMRNGFVQTGQYILSRGRANVYMIDSYAEAIELIRQGSPRRVDFSAAFLDQHLSKKERVEGYDGAQLALTALNPVHQPLSPMIFCVSADAEEMADEIKKGLKDPGAEARVAILDFNNVVGRILEIADASE